MDVIRFDRSVTDTSARRPQIACFDMLRAGAALAVVMLHAGVPYLHHRMPGLIWPADDNANRWVDAIFWTIEVMIMPLFLVIAGFLMWQSSRKVTPERLVRSRGKRLLIPFAFGLLVVLPADLYIWTLGLVAEGTVPAIKLKSLKFESPIADQIWGTSHLWFLLYVFLYVAAAALMLRTCRGRPWTSRIRWLTAPRIASVGLLAIAIGTLTFFPEVVWGFQHAFVPVPSKWIYSGVFFTAGCLLAIHDPRLQWVQSRSATSLALATILMVAASMMGTWYLSQTAAGVSVDRSAAACLAFFTVGAAAATVMGLIGAAERSLRQTPMFVRYLAAASFWIYLVHHPLLGLIHIDLKWLWPQASPLAKMLLSFVAATLLSLASYETFVRRSRFGVWLGMSWPTDRPQTAPDAHPVTVSTDQAGSKPERRAA